MVASSGVRPPSRPARPVAEWVDTKYAETILTGEKVKCQVKTINYNVKLIYVKFYQYKLKYLYLQCWHNNLK
jgi:hypothetical protein